MGKILSRRDFLMLGVLEFVEELNIKDGEQYIANNLGGLIADKYKYVPNAVEWVKRKGVITAFYLYKESPERFMDEIIE